MCPSVGPSGYLLHSSRPESAAGPSLSRRGCCFGLVPVCWGAEGIKTTPSRLPTRNLRTRNLRTRNLRTRNLRTRRLRLRVPLRIRRRSPSIARSLCRGVRRQFVGLTAGCDSRQQIQIGIILHVTPVGVEVQARPMR